MSMKATWLSVLILTASAPARAEMSGAVDDVARPAFQVVENVTDHVYDALRSYFIGGVLPDRLSRGLQASPTGDSYNLFSAEVSKREARAVARLRASYPVMRPGEAESPSQLQNWRGQVQEEQISVLVDSLRESLIDRHNLEGFGRYSGEYAKNSRNWDPDFLVPASILGGAFLYINGVQASTHVGDVTFHFDLHSGLRLREALAGAQARRLAGVEIGLRDKPLKLTADWGYASGRRSAEQVGVAYALRY